MSRYGKYSEDNIKNIPRSTAYYRKKRQRENESNESNDNSSIDDVNWRSTFYELQNDNASTSSTQSEQLSIQRQHDNAMPNNLLDELMPDEENELSSDVTDNYSQNNDIRSSSSTITKLSQSLNDTLSVNTINDSLSSFSDKVPHRFDLTPDRSALFGLISSDSENNSFQNEWIIDANGHLFEEESEDDDDNELNNVYEQVKSTENKRSCNKLLEILSTDNMNDTIHAPITVSKAEILFAVLKFGLVYNLSQSAISDLYKMINSFFGISLLPDTRYLIDKLFNCDQNIDYHAICPNCKSYIQKFDRKDREVLCTLCNTNVLLKSPTFTDFFAIINVHNEIAHSIEQNAPYFLTIANKRSIDQQNLEDFISGDKYKEFYESLSEYDKNNYVTTTFNTDGAPVFESSKFSIWPIQFMINELPFEVRTSYPIICGIWFGKDKPDMNTFLKPYVNDMNDLSNQGVTCSIMGKERQIKVFTLCCCVDSVARAPIQGLVQFNGHFGCSWCLHPGFYIKLQKGGSIKYILLDDPVEIRTNNLMLYHMEQSLTSDRPVFGVKRPSALINLNGFNIVSGIVPDSMHCIDLGIAEQFVKYWIDTNNKPYSLNKSEVANIDSMLLELKVPNQICRLSRSIKDKSSWKAREWENWILFYSIPILLCFPQLQLFVEHWSLLVKAYYILLKQNITQDELHMADEFLKQFVAGTEQHYGKSAMTYNVHQLMHLVQSVSDWGPLWAHTSYSFESGNGQILKTIHSSKGVIHQICRSIAMKHNERILQKHVSQTMPFSTINNFISYLNEKHAKSSYKLQNARYFGVNYPVNERWIDELELSNETRTYRKMVKARCLYLSSRHSRVRSNNSFASTTEGGFIEILDFIIDPVNKKEYTICKLIKTENIFDDNILPIKKIVHISRYMRAIETNTIDKVCVFLKISNVMYICSVPNLLYY